MHPLPDRADVVLQGAAHVRKSDWQAVARCPLLEIIEMRNQHDLIVCHVCRKLRLKEPEFGAQNEDSSGRGQSAVATSGSRSSLRAVSAFGETCIATKSTSAPPSTLRRPCFRST
jgi:hypothetical protein